MQLSRLDISFNQVAKYISTGMAGDVLGEAGNNSYRVKMGAWDVLGQERSALMANISQLLF